MMNAPRPADLLLPPDSAGAALPVWLATEKEGAALPGLGATQRAWLDANNFKGAARRLVLLPGEGGGLGGAVLGVGNGQSGDPAGPGALLAGLAAAQLPAGIYAFQNAGSPADAELAAIAWGLGAYRFRRYKSGDKPASAGTDQARLKLDANVDRQRVVAIVEAVWTARDLINTPASDMGPAELESATREIAALHNASVTSIVGDDLLKENFPLIHAVGRASPREPRLIDLKWHKPGGRADAPRVTLVGKGICFDTGGLDIKPSSGMLLMKKDMGGAATVLALGAMVMALGLDVRLRILIPAAENSISGNAFRPQDVIRSRDGRTVEIGNTDAEGRLVLCDALSLGDEETPDVMLTFSTLTGAARVALGPDLPPYYTDDDAFAADIASSWNGGRRSDVAAAVLAGLRQEPRQRGCGYGQRFGKPIRRLDHRGAVSEAFRQARPPFCPFRHLRLASNATAARAQGRGAARRTRDAERSRTDR